MGWFRRKPKQEAAPKQAELLPGDGSFRWRAVGESFYRDDLLRLISLASPEDRGKGEIKTTAVLMPEPSNPYDAKAIAVLIGGVKVGHVSRTDQDVVKRVTGGQPRSVSARIGWYAEAEDAPIGVQYDFTVGQPKTAPAKRPSASIVKGRAVQLQRGTQIALVDVDPEFVTMVRATRPKEPRIGHVIEVACVLDRNGDVWAFSGGKAIGRMTPDMLVLYAPEFARLARGHCYGITDCFIKPEGAKSPHALCLEYARDGITKR